MASRNSVRAPFFENGAEAVDVPGKEFHGGGSGLRRRLGAGGRISGQTLARAKQDGLQLVPVRLLAGGRYIKLIIATGKSKKKYDKRETIKQRDLARGRY